MKKIVIGKEDLPEINKLIPYYGEAPIIGAYHFPVWRFYASDGTEIQFKYDIKQKILKALQDYLECHNEAFLIRLVAYFYFIIHNDGKVEIINASYK